MMRSEPERAAMFNFPARTFTNPYPHFKKCNKGCYGEHLEIN